MAGSWGPEKPIPRLLASLLCEDAASSVALGDGRVSLQRVYFVLYADAFPAAYDRLTVVNFWFGEAGTYQESVRLLAPDGETCLAEGSSQLSISADPVTMTQMYYFPTLALPEPGEYTVEVLLDDAVVHTHTLRVVDVGEGEERDDGQN